MNNRTYIDCNATVGRRGPKDPDVPYETSVLLDEMAWCGIHGALVAHATAREFDPMLGNRMLLQELKKSPRLLGIWAVMPAQTGEIPPPRDLIREMRDNDIRAARMYPRSHRYPFNVDYCGDLLAALEDEEIPLFVEGGHMYHPDIFEPSNQVLLTELDAVLSRFPGLRVVLLNARWESTRYLHWLLTKHRNLSLDLSSHQGNRAMEVFTQWFGAERILFGTGALDKSPGAAKAFVDYCTLGEEEKRAIAGGNLARLLRLGSLPAPYAKHRTADRFLACAREGKPVRDLVIDAHAHIAHDQAAGTGFMHMPSSDAASMVERAKTMGIRGICISSFLAIWADAVGNQVTLDAMRRFPRFYHGYASFQPQYGVDWTRELRTWHGRYGMKGMKPYHPRTDIPYNDALWTPWYEYGNRHNLFALIHPSPNVVAEVNDIAQRYRNITFIMAHTGASFHDARLGIEVALKNPNVSLEITLTSVTYRVIEFMVRHVGAERVLFGTDQPMRDPIPQFGWMAYAHCSYAEKKRMFGLNMQRILRRVRL